MSPCLLPWDEIPWLWAEEYPEILLLPSDGNVVVIEGDFDDE